MVAHDNSGARRFSLGDAVALQRAGRFREAEPIYREFLRQQPDHAHASQLLGVLLWECYGDAVSAKQLIERAIELAPDNAEYFHNHAGVLSAVGELDAAVANFRRAIELKPDYAEAFFNLSGSMRFEKDEPLIAQMMALLRQPGHTRADRCFLSFALAKALDDTRQYDRAFFAYQRANALKQTATDVLAVERDGADLRARFNAQRIAEISAAGSQSTQPIFVVGMPRSGTTLVEQILSSHAQVHGLGERPEVHALNTQMRQQLAQRVAFADEQSFSHVPFLTAADVAAAANGYLQQISPGVPASAQCFVDKMPQNYRYLGLIAAMFPRARIVHCRRNPLDTCLSNWFQNYRVGQDWSFTFEGLGACFRDYNDTMSHWHHVLPVPIHTVDYEDLVRDPVAQARRLLESCGLAWDENCARPQSHPGPVRTASKWAVRQPVHTGAIARWRHYQAHLQPLVRALGGAAQIKSMTHAGCAD